MLNAIVDYGFSLGVPEETIAIVAVTAYQESSFGDQLTNNSSSALGVFQFTIGTWEKYGHLNRENFADQLVVMYERIQYFRERYSIHLSEGKIAGTMTFPEYAYASHKQGPYDPRGIEGNAETQKALTGFRDKWIILSFHVE
ncbi:hypothetical protein VI08_05950 [Luteibacter yeojuensis]|uniref:Transglycosylase SLT domain-containing protein n=1 Tax=Luteibacter yeojuensis TaxID=345309 RepID=A0A0F3KYC4_9GAMM|nr:hypothetical protein VI08_05950 [Luteibacter yeojuensis]